MDQVVRDKVVLLLGEIKRIPTLPDVYFRVKKVFEDPTLSVDYLADAIRLDQSITISILRLANSPLFGFRHKISSINQAIMLLGLREVYSLVLSVSIMGLFPLTKREEFDLFPSQKFWEHSLGVAIAARNLGTTMGVSNPEELFVAGLIHDIGKLIESIYLKDEFHKICEKAKAEGRLLVDVEQEVLGFTHAEVGQLLTENWELPNFLVQSTGHHHKPYEIEDKEVAEQVAIVNVADSLIRAMRIGWAGDPFVAPVEVKTLKMLHLLPFDDIGVIMSRVRQEYREALKALMPA